MTRPGRPLDAGLPGAQQPGTSPLHRAPPSAKLTGLALLGALVLTPTGAVGAVTLLGLVVGAAASAKLSVTGTFRSLAGVAGTAVLAGAFQAWTRGVGPAIEAAADLVTLVLAATVVTATTPVDRMLDTMTGALRPLRHLGVRPDRVGLAVALLLRAVPTLLGTVREVRAAARARGLDRHPRAWVVPGALRAVGQARATGEALAARGLGDDQAPDDLRC